GSLLRGSVVGVAAIQLDGVGSVQRRGLAVGQLGIRFVQRVAGQGVGSSFAQNLLNGGALFGLGVALVGGQSFGHGVNGCGQRCDCLGNGLCGCFGVSGQNGLKLSFIHV